MAWSTRKAAWNHLGRHGSTQALRDYLSDWRILARIAFVGDQCFDFQSDPAVFGWRWSLGKGVIEEVRRRQTCGILRSARMAFRNSQFYKHRLIRSRRTQPALPWSLH